jgi:hypothetical protein
MGKPLYGLDAQLAAVRQSIDRDEDILRIYPQAKPIRTHLEAMRHVMGLLWTVREVVGHGAPPGALHAASLSALYSAAELPCRAEVWDEEGA